MLKAKNGQVSTGDPTIKKIKREIIIAGFKDKDIKNKHTWEEHPDGHSDAGRPGAPEHHSYPHVHATSPSGEEIVVIYGDKIQW